MSYQWRHEVVPGRSWRGICRQARGVHLRTSSCRRRAADRRRRLALESALCIARSVQRATFLHAQRNIQ